MLWILCSLKGDRYEFYTTTRQYVNTRLLDNNIDTTLKNNMDMTLNWIIVWNMTHESRMMWIQHKNDVNTTQDEIDVDTHNTRMMWIHTSPELCR